MTRKDVFILIAAVFFVLLMVQAVFSIIDLKKRYTEGPIYVFKPGRYSGENINNILADFRNRACVTTESDSLFAQRKRDTIFISKIHWGNAVFCDSVVTIVHPMLSSGSGIWTTTVNKNEKFYNKLADFAYKLNLYELLAKSQENLIKQEEQHIKALEIHDSLMTERAHRNQLMIDLLMKNLKTDMIIVDSNYIIK
jgi:hypothetical protein